MLFRSRVQFTGATEAHTALNRDPGETRERLKAEALSLATQDDVWIEDVIIQTAPPAGRQPLDPAMAAALDIDPADGVHASTASYAKDLLDRVAGLRAALGDKHPAVDAAEGRVPQVLLDRAKRLLSAKLATDA